MIAYRVAAWYPKLVTRLFTFCVPSHLNKQWIDLEAHVNPTPNFAYMQQCVSGAIEEKTQDREGITQYLNALYGGYLPTGERGMSLKGAKFEIASQLLRSPLISEEELDFYVDQYSRNGLRGPRKCSMRPVVQDPWLILLQSATTITCSRTCLMSKHFSIRQAGRWH
jgi:hypothetical protein